MKRMTVRGARWAAAGLVVSCVGLSGCGGGTEVAPANPAVESTGMGMASVQGIDLGSTEMVEATLAGTRQVTAVVTDELVTFGTDGVAQLARRRVNTSQVLGPPACGRPFCLVSTDRSVTYGNTLTPSACRPGTDDFVLDAATGTMTLCTPSALSPGQSALATYRYDDDRVSVKVLVAIPTGHQVLIDVYNLDPGSTGPVTINATATAAPTDMAASLAFNLALDTNLSETTGREQYRTVLACSTPGTANCPALNELTLTRYDLTNQLNPCMAGSVVVSASDQINPDPMNRAVVTATFDDPDCG